MSHFTVLVIGGNVEQQLQPFHEFECTGTDDQYVQDVDITDEVMERVKKKGGLEAALEYHGLDGKRIRPDEKPDLTDKHKYGYVVVNNGQLIRAVRRTNPNNKWDWWVVGGRWTGYFTLKPDATGELGEPGVFGNEAPARTADIARKGDVDFDAMRGDNAREAGERWDRASAILGGRALDTWDTVRERHGSDIDAARKEYHAQPVVEDWNADRQLMWHSPEDYLCTREEHCARAARQALATFAVVKDGQWYERGSMGWWGVVADAKDHDAWAEEFGHLLDGLSDDTLLTVVDCHI